MEIEDLKMLFHLKEIKISGCNLSVEEKQELMDYEKVHLKFPSAEELPRCWIEVNFRNNK
jgi:hypothetical protein